MLLIRIQAKSAKPLNSLPKQEAGILQLAKALPEFENSFFSYDYISTHLLEFQSHLERISDDYLLPGPDICALWSSELTCMRNGK